jgi:hypothetical protein
VGVFDPPILRVLRPAGIGQVADPGVDSTR